MFFTVLFYDEPMALEFLKDIGLLRSKVQCNTCGGDMVWTVDKTVSDGYRWRCRRRNGATRCSDSRSIKHRSWFHHSNLTYLEVLLVMYGIVCREPALRIQQEHRLSAHAVADCGMFCREAMFLFMESCSVKIGGPNLTGPSKLTRASSFGESIIGDTLLRVSGCLAVWKEGLAGHFLFPYGTEPLTR